jgi:hypothetical protein
MRTRTTLAVGAVLAAGAEKRARTVLGAVARRRRADFGRVK